MLAVMQAVVLVGGLGTRLRSVVSDLPKCMAPIGGRPFLTYVLDHLERNDILDVILAVGYRGEQVRDFFGRHYSRIRLRYAVERSPLGTGGAVRNAVKMTESDDFFLLNGDTFVDINLRAMFNAHCGRMSKASIAVKWIEYNKRYGQLRVENGRAIAFLSVPKSEAGFVNCGVYVISSSLFCSAELPKKFSFESYLEEHIKELRPLVFEVKSTFIDIGVPEDYRRAIELLS